MMDRDAFLAQIVPSLMFARARDLDEQWVRNAISGCSQLKDLPQAVLDRILEEAQTALIDIELL